MDYLLNAALWFAVGLVIGWNVLPQPAWVSDLYAKIASWFGS